MDTTTRSANNFSTKFNECLFSDRYLDFLRNAIVFFSNWIKKYSMLLEKHCTHSFLHESPESTSDIQSIPSRELSGRSQNARLARTYQKVGRRFF